MTVPMHILMEGWGTFHGFTKLYDFMAFALCMSHTFQYIQMMLLCNLIPRHRRVSRPLCLISMGYSAVESRCSLLQGRPWQRCG